MMVIKVPPGASSRFIWAAQSVRAAGLMAQRNLDRGGYEG
jgi:hypothetical protein